jgi:hypothetical protein
MSRARYMLAVEQKPFAGRHEIHLLVRYSIDRSAPVLHAAEPSLLLAGISWSRKRS